MPDEGALAVVVVAPAEAVATSVQPVVPFALRWITVPADPPDSSDHVSVITCPLAEADRDDGDGTSGASADCEYLRPFHAVDR